MIAIDEKLIARNARNQTLLSYVMTCHAGHLRNSWRGPESLAAYHANPANGFYQDLLDTNAFFMGHLLVDRNEAARALRQSMHCSKRPLLPVVPLTKKSRLCARMSRRD